MGRNQSIMNRCVISSLFLLAVFLISCSKEELDLITTFQGVVLYADTNEPFTNGQIELLGSEALDFKYREAFKIDSDGSFRIAVTSLNISLFQISIISDDFGDVYQSCMGTSISQYCTLMEAGKDHSDITVFASPSN